MTENVHDIIARQERDIVERWIITTVGGRVLWTDGVEDARGIGGEPVIGTPTPRALHVTDYGPPRPCTCCPWQAQSPHRLKLSSWAISTVERGVGSWRSDKDMNVRPMPERN